MLNTHIHRWSVKKVSLDNRVAKSGNLPRILPILALKAPHVGKPFGLGRLGLVAALR